MAPRFATEGASLVAGKGGVCRVLDRGFRSSAIWSVAACCAAIGLSWTAPAAAAGVPPKPDSAPIPKPDRSPVLPSAPEQSAPAPPPRPAGHSASQPASPAPPTTPISPSPVTAAQHQTRPTAPTRPVVRPPEHKVQQPPAATAQRHRSARPPRDLGTRRQAKSLRASASLPAGHIVSGPRAETWPAVNSLVAAMLALALGLLAVGALPIAVAARIGISRGFQHYREDVTLVVFAGAASAGLAFVIVWMSG
jgi:hypothetical protein